MTDILERAKAEQLRREYEAVTMCFNCGKRAWEIDADEDANLGAIRFDRGSPGSRYEPEEPAVAYFVCNDCVKAERDAEVERLRSDFEHLGIDCSAWKRSSERKDARIKELEAERELFVSPGSTLEAALLWIKAQEAWLVEERANVILEKIRGGSIITLQDPDERRANAIRQLQAEGKIGGGKTEYGLLGGKAGGKDDTGEAHV